MQPDGINCINEQFCFFDGHHKRVKSFVTLTTSTYDLLLQKQVALATLECKHEDYEVLKYFDGCLIQHLKKSMVLRIEFH